MARGAIEPAVPETSYSDDAHPALKVPFGKMQSQHPSEQERQAFMCAVANMLDCYCNNRTALRRVVRTMLARDQIGHAEGVRVPRLRESAVLHHGMRARTQ